jgi:ankyrin repeat protein
VEINMMREVDRNLVHVTESGYGVDHIRALLVSGASANCAGGLPLRIAAWKCSAEAARLLLEHGADVNAPEDNGWTALHSAAMHGRHEIVGILLAAGADVHVVYLGQTPLTMMCKYPAIKDRKASRVCAKLLLSYGARPDDDGCRIPGVQFPPHRTPFRHAISHGRRDLVKIFLRAGARAIAVADLPIRCRANIPAFQVLDAVRAGGGWPDYVVAHRRLLAGLVAKLSAKGAVPLDAAGHVVAFYCPPGGF